MSYKPTKITDFQSKIPHKAAPTAIKKNSVSSKKLLGNSKIQVTNSFTIQFSKTY